MITKDGETVEYGYVDKPAWEWNEEKDRLWYEERDSFIVHYYTEGGGDPEPKMGIYLTVFANMTKLPTSRDIRLVVERMIAAAGLEIKVNKIWLNNWSGDTNAFWYCDIEHA